MSKSPFASFPQGPPQVPKVAVDRLGKMVEVGHLVMYHSPDDLIFEVLDIRPVMNPSLPNAMQVTFATTLNINVPAAQMCRAIVIVGESKERQADKAAGNGALGSIGPETPALVLTDLEKADVAPETISVQCTKCGERSTYASDSPVTEEGATCDSCGVGTYQRV